jgi:osmotically inducible lipoprotein OsmB
LAGGYIYDQNEKSKESAYKEGYKAGQQSPR